MQQSDPDRSEADHSAPHHTGVELRATLLAYLTERRGKALTIHEMGDDPALGLNMYRQGSQINFALNILVSERKLDRRRRFQPAGRVLWEFQVTEEA